MDRQRRHWWRPRGISWLVESASILVSAAEGTVLWLFVVSVLGRTDGLIPAGVIIGLTVFATMSPRVLNAFDIWPPVYEIMVAVLILVSTLGMVKVIVFPQARWTELNWLRAFLDALILRGAEPARGWAVVLLAAVVWWRGQRRDDLTLDSANAGLRLGVPLLILALLAHAAAGSPAGEGAATAAAAGFFAATLAAISIARYAADRAARGTRGETTLPVSPGAVVFPVLIVLAAGALLSGLATRDLLDTVVLVLSPLVWALLAVFRAFVLLAAAISFLLALPFIWLLNQVDPEGQTFTASGTPVPADDLIRPAAERTVDLPDPVRYLAAGALLVLLFAAAIAFRLRHPRPTFIVGAEERESTFGLGRVFSDLGSSLKSLLRRPDESDSLAALRHDSHWAQTVAIREIYRQVLSWAGDRGLSRRQAETPSRHAARLHQQLPATSRSDLETIVSRYNAARYGAGPASRRDADEVRTAWRRLQRGEERAT